MIEDDIKYLFDEITIHNIFMFRVLPSIAHPCLVPNSETVDRVHRVCHDQYVTYLSAERECILYCHQLSRLICWIGGCDRDRGVSWISLSKPNPYSSISTPILTWDAAAISIDYHVE